MAQPQPQRRETPLQLALTFMADSCESLNKVSDLLNVWRAVIERVTLNSCTNLSKEECEILGLNLIHQLFKVSSDSPDIQSGNYRSGYPPWINEQSYDYYPPMAGPQPPYYPNSIPALPAYDPYQNQYARPHPSHWNTTLPAPAIPQQPVFSPLTRHFLAPSTPRPTQSEWPSTPCPSPELYIRSGLSLPPTPTFPPIDRNSLLEASLSTLRLGSSPSEDNRVQGTNLNNRAGNNRNRGGTSDINSQEADPTPDSEERSEERGGGSRSVHQSTNGRLADINTFEGRGG